MDISSFLSLRIFKKLVVILPILRNVRVLVVILLTCLSRSGVDLTKTRSDATCLGEWGFFDVGCCSSIIASFIAVFVVSFFIHCFLTSSLIVKYRQVFQHILYFQPSSSQSNSWHFHFNLSGYSFCSFTGSVMVLSRLFVPAGVFYLTLFANVFGTTCFYQGLPGNWQFSLKVYRASCWSS